jgi:GTP diphosphokinase / guanosine-3',5'-bis(diphosphate) 3'-diphosphatase
MDQAMYQKALDFATLAHHGQKRLSGEDFITHPVAVAQTLSDWHLDDTAIIAGLLHDTVEDGGATREDLVKEFGEDVARIVEGVTKITKIHLKGSNEEQFVENLRKMILVMAQDLRVVLVKLADRLHNMQTLKYLSSESQIENAKETLEIYAPLADRLGMGEIKGQLEDLAFPFVYPEDYKWLSEVEGKNLANAQNNLDKIKKEILKAANTKEITVQSRIKHMYSLYRKLLRPDINKDLSKIFDLVALRILVNSVEDCYKILGIVHGLYRPIPYLGVRDYIANPKPNGYRSIHTSVFGPNGFVAEVQIRTREMHSEAEMGVAAHWQYAEVKSKSISNEKLHNFRGKTKLDWVKQLASWQNEMTNTEEYIQALKFDALRHRNLVFSPIGDVYDLPIGATPIDYAYAVHTKLGHQANGAKVNGKMVPLSYQLVNGDVVEIIVDQKRSKPSHEWLNFVVTTKARQEIAKILKS